MQLRKTTPCSKTFYQKRWIWKTRWCQRLAVKSKAFSNAKKNRNNGQEKCFADVINSLRKVGFLAFCVTRLVPHTFRPLSGAKWEWLMFEVLIIADNFLRRGNDNDVKKTPEKQIAGMMQATIRKWNHAFGRGFRKSIEVGSVWL